MLPGLHQGMRGFIVTLSLLIICAVCAFCAGVVVELWREGAE